MERRVCFRLSLVFTVKAPREKSDSKISCAFYLQNPCLCVAKAHLICFRYYVSKVDFLSVLGGVSQSGDCELLHCIYSMISTNLDLQRTRSEFISVAYH